MDFQQVLRERKSYRKHFKDIAVSKNLMRNILEAAYLAPSGCNLQTTKMIGVLDSKKVKAIAEIYNYEWAKTSKAAVIMVTKPLTLPGFGISRYKEDFAAAAENLLLAVADSGLATTWIQGQIENEKAVKIAELLNVEDGYSVIGYFPLGYPADEVTQPKKQSFEERCFLDTFGKPFK